jgi:hypothetical protein
MALTYAQIVQLVQDYTENTEDSFIANIPIFVQLAERRIYNSIAPPAMRKNLVGNMTANNRFLTAPEDFLAIFELSYTDAAGEEHYLLNKDANFILESFPDITEVGPPTHYGLLTVAVATPYTTTLVLGPVPDQNYVTTFNYFAYPTSIVSADTSYLGNNFEFVLLYGTLREAYIYMKGEQDLIDRYDKMYMEALMLTKGVTDGRDRRDTYRNQLNRVPPP